MNRAGDVPLDPPQASEEVDTSFNTQQTKTKQIVMDEKRCHECRRHQQRYRESVVCS